jgi:hypothetical protein
VFSYFTGQFFSQNLFHIINIPLNILRKITEITLSFYPIRIITVHEAEEIRRQSGLSEEVSVISLQSEDPSASLLFLCNNSVAVENSLSLEGETLKQK